MAAQRLKEAAEKAKIELSSAMSSQINPVSYTHLDVYKRQDEGQPGGSAAGIVPFHGVGVRADDQVAVDGGGHQNALAVFVGALEDVYKRQPLVLGSMGMPACRVSSFSGIRPTPVSYTHLDVYKRQAQFLSSG